MQFHLLSSTVLASLLAALPSTNASPLERRAGTLVGYGAGTTGGAGGSVTTVTSCSALKTAVTGTNAKIVRIESQLTGCGILDVGSNTSIFGKGSNAGLKDGGFRVRKGTNVIFQNLKLGPAPKKGDIIAIDQSTKIWVDHCEFASVGLVGGKDDYDGLLDISHASDFITVSWNKFHDHHKGSLIGHSDNNAAQDTGKLHITYHHNHFYSVGSRLPSVRFGTVHVYNSYYADCPISGINSRMNAQVRVENSVFENVPLAMVTNRDSDLEGNLCDVGNVLSGTSTKQITKTCNLKVPYSYSLESAASAKAAVLAGAGVGKVAP